MQAVSQNADDLVMIMRYVARTIALLLAVVVLYVAVGEMNFSQLSGRAIAQGVAFFLVWIGLILALRWDGAGAVLITGGMILFLLLDYFLTGSVLRFWILSVFFIPGLLLMYCWCQTRQSTQQK
jgi:hypothetical protein